MKFEIIKRAGQALALTALLATQAKAQLVVAPAGSVLLGLEQAGQSNNLVVNLGSYTNFLTAGQFGYSGSTGAYVNPGVAVAIPGLSLTDLSGVFNDWNNNGQLNLVQWGVVGYNSTTATGTTLGIANRTIFYTVGREDPLVQSTAPNRSTGSSQNNFASTVNTLRSTLGATNQTANSSSSGLISAGAAGSFSTLADTGGGFNYGVNVEQSLNGSYRGPTNSVLDFYASVPTGTTGLAPVLLGTFSLNNSGILSFTAVPEPSTYALMALGLGSLVLLRRKAKPVKVTVKS
jgi:hypothetical protein